MPKLSARAGWAPLVFVPTIGAFVFGYLLPTGLGGDDPDDELLYD